MKEKIYKVAPLFIQNIIISIYNFLAYKKRHGGNYKNLIEKFNKNTNLSLASLRELQNNRFLELINTAKQKSKFYNNLYKDIVLPQTVEQISSLPIVDKEMLRKNIEDVYTIDKHHGIISKTGGTTGKSLEVVYTKEDIQERFALLDYFRGTFGYKLGKRTAWFSGKNIITERDIKRQRFWKTDYLYNVRYYSTFHIKEDYMKNYIANLLKFSPEYIVGFPISMYEIAKYGLKNAIDFPKNTVKAIFPTAETVTKNMRNDIELFFKCKMYNQYASSEGAPFIFECSHNNLHLELQSGVFEVLDNNNNPTKEGNLIVTSFTTNGTPLIRYNIGDSIKLSNRSCNCINNNPLVEQILGRADDYVYSIENGKVTFVNLANAIKDIHGVTKSQIQQDALDTIVIKVIKDPKIFTDLMEKKLMANLIDRIGMKTQIQIVYVDDIPAEASGKFRMIKNNIKHLL